MSDEEQMNMVEILSEELGQKEVRLMAHENEIKHLREERMLFVQQIFIHENILFNGWDRRYDFRYDDYSDIEKFIEQVNEHAIDFSMKERCFEMCEEVNDEYQMVDLEELLTIIEEGAMGWDESEDFDKEGIRSRIIEETDQPGQNVQAHEFLGEDTTIYYFCQNFVCNKSKDYRFLVELQ